MESFSLRHGSRRFPLKRGNGFTLVELMVVLAIIVIVTSVVLTNQTSFNKTLVLSNTAYDIALTLRSAETFGIGSRADVTTGITATNAGYGVHFSNGTPSSFLLYADTSPGVSCDTPDCKPGDHVYKQGDTLIQTYQFGNGITVSDFCAFAINGTHSCASEGNLNSLDITFSRPNPDALIGQDGSYTGAASACIEITSPQGGAKYVSVSSSGQIIANATSCRP